MTRVQSFKGLEGERPDSVLGVHKAIYLSLPRSSS